MLPDQICSTCLRIYTRSIAGDGRLSIFTLFLLQNTYRYAICRKYLRYEGLPHILSCKSAEQKRLFLNGLLQKIYLQDTAGLNRILRFDKLEKMVAFYASSIGSFLSMSGLEDTFRAKDKGSVSINTIRAYSLSLQSIFLINMVTRYDIKKRKHIASPVKFYFEDTGCSSFAHGHYQNAVGCSHR